MPPPSSNSADKIFLILAGILLLFGLIMLSSASTVIAYQRYQDGYYFVKQQIIRGIIPGLILFFIFKYIPYRVWKQYAVWGYAASIFLLSAVFLPGVGLMVGGARRWLVLGGITIQPAEIAKFFLIIFLAAWFSRKIEAGQGMNGSIRESLLPFLWLTAPIALPIVFQPDIGTLMVLVAIAVTLYFMAGAPWRHLGLLLITGLAALAVLIKIAPYRLARFTAFLNPDIDPQGIGYHIQQALLAVGSGGWFGVGIGRSQQKFLYLPEVAGDSIFAVMAEELGFIFSALVVLLFLAFIYRGIQIAHSTRDPFANLIVIGGMAWVGWQTIINIGAMIGLFPLTGIPLPFVSFGGTSIAMLLALVGLIANISAHQRT